MRWLQCALLVLLAVGCTSGHSAREALRAQGFTGIRLTGYAPFSCGEDDWSSTGFEATNAQGAHVEGVVCCGLVIKSCTVRW